MNIKQIFGNNVKYYRFQKGLTQEQFSEKIDISTSYISEIENGHSGVTFEKVEIIAKVLGVEIFQLFQKNVNSKHLPNRVDMIKK